MDKQVTCDECDGAGEWCAICKENPDNCDCEIKNWEECSACNGEGFVEEDDEDDDGESDEEDDEESDEDEL